jgi:hypothetical protein
LPPIVSGKRSAMRFFSLTSVIVPRRRPPLEISSGIYGRSSLMGRHLICEVGGGVVGAAAVVVEVDVWAYSETVASAATAKRRKRECLVMLGSSITDSD